MFYLKAMFSLKPRDWEERTPQDDLIQANWTQAKLIFNHSPIEAK